VTTAASLPADWRSVLAPTLRSAWYADLVRFVDRERDAHDVFPPPADVFAAFTRTPLARVRVLLLGQDPYHAPHQACGLAFSVRRGVPVPASLRNIHRELADDVGVPIPGHGDLSAWAENGVLLLNTVLTVRAGKAHSHRGKGWERFTDAVIQALVARREPFVALLWGTPAARKARLLDARHPVVQGVHPSPLSAHRGFFGSRPFSAVDRALRGLGHAPMDWRP
jgi:uracil-DNA glycosylase